MKDGECPKFWVKARLAGKIGGNIWLQYFVNISCPPIKYQPNIAYQQEGKKPSVLTSSTVFRVNCVIYQSKVKQNGVNFDTSRVSPLLVYFSHSARMHCF